MVYKNVLSLTFHDLATKFLLHHYHKLCPVL